MDTLNGLFGWREISEEKEVGKATEEGRQTITCMFIGVLRALAFVLLLTSVTFLPTAHAAFPGVNGKIAFVSNRDGNLEIYVMNADGSGQTRLTNNPASDFGPAWSPDGTKIAFGREEGGSNEVFVMNADGSAQTNLTNHPSSDYNATWSPDGTKIAFVSLRDGDPEIFVMNADGTGQTQLTFNGPNEDPSWSPDGTKIAYDNQVAGIREIFVMNPDGTGQTNLTNNGGFNSDPDWSPDGTKIAYHSGAGFCGPNCEVFVMNANGSGQTNLTNNPSSDSHPKWSPDGTRIVFRSNRDEVSSGEIYVMNAADGTGVTRLTNNPTNGSSPDWQPLLTIPVAIDIEPGSFPNSINPRSKGVIPVAILTTDTFAATTVDPLSVAFGPNGAVEAHGRGHIEDADGDGDLDLVLHFRTQDTGIQCGNTSASLTGETFSGQAIEGSDSIKTSGCE